MDNSIPEDLTTKAGFIKRSRKALVAAVIGLAGSLGPKILEITADGVVTGGEVITSTVVSLGVGIAAGLAVWYTPNAQ